LKDKVWIIILAVGLLLGACSKSGEGPQPPEIRFGMDTCAACGMIISDARFAAGTILTNGETRIFDDIGEMLIYHMDNPTEQVVAWFVHDYLSEKWVNGESAYYVAESDLTTPMGYGIAAFATKETAEAFIDEHGGMIYKLDDLRINLHEEVHGN
jgi:copper chaperone NosL